jgi:hypothetical protein
METSLVLQGRRVGPTELQQVRQLLAAEPTPSRYRLSRQLCDLWDWRSPTGQLKDMAARSLLLKLEQRGLVTLPPRRLASPNRMRHKQLRCLQHASVPVSGPLSDLMPLHIIEVSQRPDALAVFESLLHQYHYLSYTSAVGHNLKYLVRDRQGRELACLLFGAAAWRCAARDRFLGWDPLARPEVLARVCNNARFLIVPWVQVPHLASHILGRVTARLRRDWRAKYAMTLSVVETFVQMDRFRGTCYRAANWIEVGQTTGRSRQDRYNRLIVPQKSVWLYPLVPSFRRELGVTA